MNCDTTTTRLKRFPGNFRRSWLAFTLIEMLLVITIIAVMAAIGLPHLKGWGESNAMTAATRQLMDDLSLARLKAINSRATVYVVFVSPDIVKPNFLTNASAAAAASNLYSGQYTTYALFTKRQVGEQPGRENPRYLTPWKSLPENVFIAALKFLPPRPPTSRFSASYSETNRPFGYELLPFPGPTNPPVLVPCLAFNSQGQLISEDENPLGVHKYHEAVIPLARGSIFYARSNGIALMRGADVIETPPQNSVSNYNNIRVDWITGRARVERKEIQ